MPDKIIHQIQVDGYCARFGGKWGRLQLGTFGSYGIEQLQITLGDSWTDLVVYANFVTADGTTPVLVPESGLVDVPPEATAKPGMGNIVLDGTADGVRIYSVDIPYIMLNHSDLSGEAPTPTPDRWEQYIVQVQGIVDAAVPPGGNDGDVLTKTPDGNAWQAPQGGSGGAGQDGGYYTPSIQQTAENAAQVSWTASDDAMPPVEPVTLTLPQGPQGVPGAPGQDGQQGPNGEPGPAGENGITPNIGENGNWYLGDVDTGKPSRGEQGPAGQDGAQGIPGADGAPGQPGAAAGFGEISATATQLASGAQPTFNAEWSGPNEAKNLVLSVGIPAGPQGPAYTLTPEDTQTIVQAVLAALPNGDEVSY